MSISEMIFLGVLGLVIFGPKRLAAVAPEVGKTLARFKAMSGEFKSQLNTELSTAANDHTTERPLADTVGE